MEEWELHHEIERIVDDLYEVADFATFAILGRILEQSHTDPGSGEEEMVA